MVRRHGLWSLIDVAKLTLAILSAMFLVNCGSGATVNNIPLPVITVSPLSASVSAGAQLQFAATVASVTPTTLTWAVNNIQGGNSTVGTITAAGLYVAPVVVPSPPTVTVKAISSAETNPFGAALVKVTPSNGKVAVSISPVNLQISTGSTQQFVSGVTGTSDPSVGWTVNGILGGSSVVGTIDSTGFYTAPSVVPNPAFVTVTATSAVQTSSSSSATVTISSPSSTVNVSPGSTSIWAASTAQFSASTSGNANPSVLWAVNGIEGGNSTVGTICNPGVTGCPLLGVYTAPAIAPNPPSVTITATVQSGSNPTGTATVTIAPPSVEAIAPTDPSIVTGGTVQLTASVIPANSSDIVWSVNGIVGGNSTVGTICNFGDASCTSPGLYTAPAALPAGGTVALTVMGQTDSTDAVSAALTLSSSNVAPLSVKFGPNGNTGNSNTAGYNGLFTTISVCLASTPQCQIIPNILVDTGSVGLRLFNSTLTSVPANAFAGVKDSTGNQVQEFVQFPDASYAWGPVLVGDVRIAGEKATSVPFQLLGITTFPVPLADCLSLGAGTNLNSVAVLGANGILGVGSSIQDCGLNCAGGQTFAAYPYYVCPLNVCERTPLPVAQQVTNPVALFPKDNNGVLISLPSIPDAGAPSLPYVNADGTGLLPAGQITFGVGTESNNALGSATLFPLDTNGRIPKLVYNNAAYVSEGFPDTRSNALRILNAPSLAILGCTDNPYYCPNSTSTVSIVACTANADAAPGLPCGNSVTSETLSLNIANADLLFTDNSDFSAFNNLGRESLTTAPADQFDLGLPFFYGRSIFIGIAGTTVPTGASAPNGYVAF